MKNVFVVAFALVALLVSTSFANAIEYTYMNETGWMMTHDIGKMLGREVKDPDGRVIAKVADMVMGNQNRVAFMILAYNQAPGKENLVAVPFDAFVYNEADKTFILDASKDKLASAPKFGDLADLAGHEFSGKLYRYFGVQPYWEIGKAPSGNEMGQKTPH
jgi:hypothetical protein